jgi:hypothetical protein
VKRGRDADADTPTAAEMCRQTFERIAREGRKFGLGLVLSSQRPSELSPTVLAQCNTFLLHRIVNDRDQELVGKLVPDNLGGLAYTVKRVLYEQELLLPAYEEDQDGISPVPNVACKALNETKAYPENDDRANSTQGDDCSARIPVAQGCSSQVYDECNENRHQYEAIGGLHFAHAPDNRSRKLSDCAARVSDSVPPRADITTFEGQIEHPIK